MLKMAGFFFVRSGMTKVRRVDATNIDEQEAIRRFGKPMNDFMKAVAKARKKYGIEAYALWMYHHGAMRQCSMGKDEVGRSIAYQVALMMGEQSQAIMEDVARKMEGKPDQ